MKNEEIDVTAEYLEIDRALRENGEASTTIAESQERSENGVEKLSGVTALLRTAGTFALIGSAVSFGVQNWGLVDSTVRFSLFLGLTVLIAVVGAFCVTRLKDPKGARTLFAIATAFLPAHFAQLGAFLYREIVGRPKDLPSFFVLESNGLHSLFGILAISIPLLTIVAVAGFSALARRERLVLTTLYLALNLLILYPSRDGVTVALLSLAAAVTLFVVELKIFSRVSDMRTQEAYFARTILLAPLALPIFRNLFLYSPSYALLALSCGVIAGVSYLVAREQKSEPIVAVLDMVTMAGAAASTSMLSRSICSGEAIRELVYSLGYQEAFSSAALYLPIAGVVFLLSFVVHTNQRQYRIGAAWTAILTVTSYLFTTGGVPASLLCMFVATATLVASYIYEERSLFAAGVGGALFGLLFHIRYAVELYQASPWLTLAALGLAVVVCSSYLERNANSLIGAIKRMTSTVCSWQ